MFIRLGGVVKRPSVAIVLLWAAGSVCGVGRAEEELHRYSYAELHMATMFQMVLYASDQTLADRAAEATFKRIADLDAMMTDYDPSSELMQLCQRAVNKTTAVGPDLFRIFQTSELVAKKSDGAFDITVGPLVRLWRQARKSRQLPSVAEIAQAERLVGHDKLRLDKRHQTVTLAMSGMRLDLGGIAKGFAADEALKVLRSFGIRRAMVAASGDIGLGDPPPGKLGWDIGIASIDHPLQGLTGEVWLHNMGISTSGDTEQYVEINGQRYSHIVNPKTGYGLTERIGVTILAPNATTSDALATAVSVMGEKKGLALVEKWPRLACLIVVLTPEGKKVIPSKRYAAYATAHAESRRVTTPH